MKDYPSLKPTTVFEFSSGVAPSWMIIRNSGEHRGQYLVIRDDEPLNMREAQWTSDVLLAYKFTNPIILRAIKEQVDKILRAH